MVCVRCNDFNQLTGRIEVEEKARERERKAKKTASLLCVANGTRMKAFGDFGENAKRFFYICFLMTK